MVALGLSAQEPAKVLDQLAAHRLVRQAKLGILRRPLAVRAPENHSG